MPRRLVPFCLLWGLACGLLAALRLPSGHPGGAAGTPQTAAGDRGAPAGGAAPTDDGLVSSVLDLGDSLLNASRTEVRRKLFGFGIVRENDNWIDSPTCGIDVSQAGFLIEEASLQIRQASLYCTNTTTATERVACTYAISNIFAFIGFAADFFEGAAQQCNDRLVAGALCGETITHLMAGLGQIIESAAGVKVLCSNASLSEYNRRLQGQGFVDPWAQPSLRWQQRHWAQEAASWDQGNSDVQASLTSGSGIASQMQTAAISAQSASVADATVAGSESMTSIYNDTERDLYGGFQCFLNAAEVAVYLARAGNIIGAGEKDCNVVNTVGSVEGQEACALDVIGIIESFMYMANSVARSVFRCPLFANLDAKCAASAINIVSSVGALLNSLTGSNLCVKPFEEGFIYHETHLRKPIPLATPPPLLPPPPPPPGVGLAPSAARQTPNMNMYYPDLVPSNPLAEPSSGAAEQYIPEP